MKRCMSLTLSSIIMVLSLAACSPRNTSMNNRPNNTNIENINYSKNTTRMRKYKDGVYSAAGNRHAYGNEMAAVTIKNGIISDVTLTAVDNKGKTITDNVINNTNNIGTNIAGSTNGTTNVDGTTNNNIGTIKRTNRIIIPKTTNARNNMTQSIGLNGTNRGTTGVPLTQTEIIPNAPGSITNTSYGTTANTSLQNVRRNLSSAIIRAQTPSVTINTQDSSLASRIQNWKLAVDRALDKAAK